MRPGGPTNEAGCTLKGPRARVTRGDGAVAKRRTGEAGCGPPGRDYKGAPPTPIFRGSAKTKSAANGPPSIQSCVKDRSPMGRDSFASSQRWSGSREPGARSADAGSISLASLDGLEPLQMTHAQRRRQLENRNEGGIVPAFSRLLRYYWLKPDFSAKRSWVSPRLRRTFRTLARQNPHIQPADQRVTSDKFINSGM